MVQSLWGFGEAQPQASLDKFHSNTLLLQKALAMWHSTNFSDIEANLEMCKKAMLFLDTIEEKRTLMGYEY